MNKSHPTHINGIGPVLLEHSTRAKRIIISVRPQKGVRVAIPMRTSFKAALEFVSTKKQWIRKHLARIEQYERNKQDAPQISIDRAKAKKELTTRLHQLAKKHRFIYNRVFIRNQKTRWGSCSTKGNISLNIKLVMLPEELINYVLVHELVHTKICNHSKRFWGEMDKYVGNGKEMASRLKKYDLRLI